MPYFGLEVSDRVGTVDGAQRTPDTVGASSTPGSTWRTATIGTIRRWAGRVADVDVFGDESDGSVTEETVDAARVSTGWLVDAVFTVPATLRAAWFIGTEDRSHPREGGCTVRPTRTTPRLRTSARISLVGAQHGEA